MFEKKEITYQKCYILKQMEFHKSQGIINVSTVSDIIYIA